MNYGKHDEEKTMKNTEDSNGLAVMDRPENDLSRCMPKGQKGVQRVVDVISNLGGKGDSDEIHKVIPSVSISTILVGLRLAAQQGLLVENKHEQERRRAESCSTGGRPRKVYFLASALRRDGDPVSPRLSMFVEAALKNRHELDRAWMAVAACAPVQMDDEAVVVKKRLTHRFTVHACA